MSEKEFLDRLVVELKKFNREFEAEMLKSQGRLEVGRRDNATVLTWHAMNVYSKTVKETTIPSLEHITSWIDRVEKERIADRNLMLKLLGLMPDATEEEIRDAVDDVGPVIAGYRKKKRGT
jgi:hypothetical protein